MKKILSLTLAVAVFTVASLQVSTSQAGLIGWWKLDEGSGDTLADSSASGTTGTITNADTGGLGAGGSAWVDDADRGNVLSFNGSASGAFARIGDIPTMTLDQDFTWAFWGNQDASNTSPNDVVFGNRFNENGVDFAPREFIKFTPTKFEWHSNGNGNDNLEYDDLPAGQWIHHAVVKDGASLTYYRDGVEANAGTITQALNNPQPLFIGGINTNQDGENWAGLMSDVRIYDHALAAGEVAAIVPEPSTFLLAIFGFTGLAVMLRRKMN